MPSIFPAFLGGRAAGGLLAVRLAAGAAMMLHGWPKIQHPFSWMNPSDQVPAVLQSLAALAEFGGGICWLLGIVTPLVSFLILGDMAVAIMTVHIAKGHAFVASDHGSPSAETAVLYFVIALLLFLAGPGRFSLDWWLFGRRRTAAEPTD